MIWWFELILFGLVIIAAVVALSMRDLIAAVAALTLYSLLVATLLALMGAVDVSLTEATLGAGITGVLLIVAISLMQRRSVD